MISVAASGWKAPAVVCASVGEAPAFADEPNTDTELLSVCRAIHAIDQAIGRPRMMRRGATDADVAADIADAQGPVRQARDLIARATNLPALTQEEVRAKTGIVNMFSYHAKEWRLAVWICPDDCITDLTRSLAEDVALAPGVTS